MRKSTDGSTDTIGGGAGQASVFVEIKNNIEIGEPK